MLLLKDNFTILNEQEIDNFYDKVMDIYEEYDIKLSLTDASILLLMEYYDIPTLVSFDEGFKKNEEINLINLDSISEKNLELLKEDNN
ncbi:MAG: PIN domain-containing protein [Methanosphaera sp.]|nr:PIN domain-containing protein [Methanosphaera sp.]